MQRRPIFQKQKEKLLSESPAKLCKGWRKRAYLECHPIDHRREPYSSLTKEPHGFRSRTTPFQASLYTLVLQMLYCKRRLIQPLHLVLRDGERWPLGAGLVVLKADQKLLLRSRQVYQMARIFVA